MIYVHRESVSPDYCNVVLQVPRMPETLSFAPRASYLEANWGSIHTTDCADLCCANVDIWTKNLGTYSWLWIEIEWGTSRILPVKWTNKLILPEGKPWDLDIVKLSQLEQKQRKIMDV